MDWSQFNFCDFLTMLGFGIAAVEFALLRVQKKQQRAHQYIVNSIANLAMAKARTWNEQLTAELVEYKKEEAYSDVQKLLARGSQEFQEIFQTATTLEGSIDPDSSANLDTTKRNLEHQNLWSQFIKNEDSVQAKQKFDDS